MIPTLRILLNMGQLHRLAPLFVFGLVVMVSQFQPWMLFALVYGVIMQFLVEYAMHRFLFHREPPTAQGAFNTLYRSHIGHHEFPTDPEFFTGDDHWYAVRFGVASIALHFVVLWPFTGWQVAMLFPVVAVLVGSIAAFTFYEYCHTLAHLNVPKGWVGQRITRSHLAHHYQDHQATFQVSFGMGWIDWLFGTKHDKAVARARFDRKTMLSLGMDPEDLRLATARKAFGVTAQPGAGRARPSEHSPAQS
jgi:hypothetical protein